MHQNTCCFGEKKSIQEPAAASEAEAAPAQITSSRVELAIPPPRLVRPHDMMVVSCLTERRNSS